MADIFDEFKSFLEKVSFECPKLKEEADQLSENIDALIDSGVLFNQQPVQKEKTEVKSENGLDYEELEGGLKIPLRCPDVDNNCVTNGKKCECLPTTSTVCKNYRKRHFSFR